MHIFPLSSPLSLLFLIYSLAFGEARCPADVTPVQYHSLGYSHMSIPVWINGSGPYEFLVDTGAEITTIEPSLAAMLGLEPRGHGGLTSAVGRSVVEIVVPELIEVGGLSVRQLLIAVQNLSQLRTLNRRLRGILGEDFLAHFDVLIDRKQRILCIDETGQIQQSVRGERIPLLAGRGRSREATYPQRLLIAVTLFGSGAQQAIFCLDSGTNLPLLREGVLKRNPWIQWNRPMRGSTADRAASFIPLWPPQDIRIGTHVLREIAFVTPVTTAGTAALDGEDGELPTSLFERIFISHAGRFVILEPR